MFKEDQIFNKVIKLMNTITDLHGQIINLIYQTLHLRLEKSVQQKKPIFDISKFYLFLLSF